MKKNELTIIALLAFVFCGLPVIGFVILGMVTTRYIHSIVSTMMEPGTIPTGTSYFWEPVKYDSGKISRVGSFTLPIEVKTPGMIKPLKNEALISTDPKKTVIFFFFPARKESEINAAVTNGFACFVNSPYVTSNGNFTDTSGADCTVSASFTSASESFSSTWIIGQKSDQDELKGEFMKQVNSPASPIAGDPRLRALDVTYSKS